jgi:hypothetical protein
MKPRPGVATDSLLDCPTYGLPAEITDRFILDGVATPVEHVKLVCVKGHWYTPPIDQLLVSQREHRSAAPSTPVAAWPRLPPTVR